MDFLTCLIMSKICVVSFVSDEDEDGGDDDDEGR